MKIDLERGNGEPIHFQIAESIRSQILDGHLRPGQRLPAIRELAKELAVHRLTVHKAYEQLVRANLVEAKIGSGTFVASEFSRRLATEILGRVAIIGPMNRFEVVSEDAGIRSLATNVPDPWLFRADEFLFECYELRKASPWIFYYSPPAGAHELCRVLAEQLTAKGLPTSESQIVVTNGNTHSLNLVLNLLSPPGHPVAIEAPMFLGAKSWFLQRGFEYVPIPKSGGELDTAKLREAIQTKGCRTLVLWPAYGHVTGWVQSESNRAEVVAMCQELDCHIIEMASTSWVSIDGPPPKPLSIDVEVGKGAYLDDFSSAISPGLRVAYVRVSTDVARQLEAKLQNEQHSGVQFVQIALANYIERGLFKGHLERSIPKYRARRDRLMSSLKMHMPGDAQWSRPAGGFSCWLELPAGTEYGGLFQKCLDRGVAFSSGSLFIDRPDADRFARISYGTQEPPAIEEAVRILGDVVRGLT